ncbi:MAG: glycosyltransferase 61 family protein [Sphingomonas sp.]
MFIFLSEIMRGELKILTPPLREWQKVFLNRMGISDSAIQEVNAETCRCERVIFPGSLCDNLNFPSPITRAMLDYMKLSGEGQSKINAPRRIYVSRKKYDSRQMLNESELISALNNLGFINICPEDYSIDQQIEIFSGSEIIVGEIGAALSNIAFTDRYCHVIEIIPELKPSVWIKNLCSLLNLKWTSVYCKVPEEFRTLSVVDGIEYNNLIFSYNVSVDDVISAVRSSILDV